MSPSSRPMLAMVKAGLFAIGILSGASMALARLSVHLELSGQNSGEMPAAQPVDLGLHFFDTESNESLHHFHPMHGKPLHLIVVRDDLSTFAHLHPEAMGDHHAMFSMRLNAPSDDPDNFDAPQAIPKAGRYFLFAEAMPMGYSMTTVTQSLVATGPEVPTTPFALDPVDETGTIHKDLGDYHFSLQVETYPECGTFSVMLRALVERRDSDGALKPVADLEPWLEAFGHAILISRAGNTVEAKTFSHLHAVWPLPDDPAGPRGPGLELTSDAHQPMQEGEFRLWLQLKHQGRVLTVPFEVNIVKPQAFAFCSRRSGR